MREAPTCSVLSLGICIVLNECTALSLRATWKNLGMSVVVRCENDFDEKKLFMIEMQVRPSSSQISLRHLFRRVLLSLKMVSNLMVKHWEDYVRTTRVNMK